MKIHWKVLLLALLTPLLTFAQSPQDWTSTANLGLKKPNLGSTNWGIYVNQDFDTLDAAIGVFKGGFVTDPFNASYVVDLTKGNTHQMTLFGDTTITSVNQPGIVQGQLLYLIACQDATGGHAYNFSSLFQTPLPSVTTTPNKCTDTTWQWNGTLWISAGGGGGAGGATPSPPNNALQKTSGSSLASSSVVDDGTNVSVGNNARFTGPNPYVDITQFGARAVNPNTTPAATGITANCTTLTPNTVVISPNASTFQNGDGVVLYGCGAAQSMSTPSAPTITPSVAAGPVNTLLETPGPTGSTTYHYYLIARDRSGGITAPSPVGTTTTGAAALGPQTVNITSMARSGQVVTAVTAAHGLPTSLTLAPEIYVGGGNSLSDASFYGEFSVNTVADSTHVTFLTAASTLLGATASATGGTMSWYNDNKVTWSGVTGAVEYGVYSDRQVAGTCALIGVSTPTGANNDFQFDDFGQTFGSNQAFNPVFPASFSCASPPSATSDSLSTTISAGAGTTTLTLTNAVSTTVNGATIRIDAAPGIAAAAASITNRQGTLYIPCDKSGNQFVVNSWLQLGLGAFSVGECGPLYLNDTLELTGAGGNGNGGVKWLGDQFPQYGGGPSVGAWSTGPTISINTAHPGIYLPSTPTGQFAVHVGRLNLSGVPNNGTQAIFAEASFNDTFDWINCASGNGAGDLLSNCFTFRQAFGAGASNLTLNYVTLAPGGTAAPDGGGSNVPTVMCRLSATSSNGSGCGNIIIPNSYSVHRGMFFQNSPGVQIGVGGVAYINGGFTPLVTHYHGSVAGDGTIFGVVVLDTFSHPCLANLSTFAANSNVQFLGNACGPSSVGPGNAPAITGPSGQIAGGFLPTFYGNTGGLVSAFTTDSILNTTNYPSKSYNSAIRVGPVFPVFIDENALAAPTCSVSAGGSVPVGTATFQIVPMWQNGGVGNLSPSSTSCSTTSGNQTITINWSAAAGNPKDYRIYEIGISGSGYLALSAGALANQTSYVWSSVGVTGGSFPSIPAGGPTMLMPGTQGMSSPSFVMTDPGGFGGSLVSTTLTAARAHTFPNNTGTVAELNLAQTWTANQSVANGNSIRWFSTNGTNYAGFTGGASTSNLVWLFPTTDSTGTQCLSSNGSLQLAWSACSAGSGTPGGSNTQVQFNSTNTFGGSTNLTWVSPTLTIGVAGSATGALAMTGATSGTATITPQTTAGSPTLTLPNTTGTLADGASAPLALSATTGNLTCATCTTNAAALTANQLVIGGGGQAAAALGSLGTTTTVLHGNASGTPTFSAITLTTDVTGTLPIANGGTGQTTASAAFNALSPMTTAGDVIYGGASGAGTRLAAGTATQLLHSGTTPSWAAVTLTTDVTGTLPIANGGSGQTTASAAFNALSPITSTGDLILGTGTNTAGRLGIGTNGLCLVSNGTTATWNSCAAGSIGGSGVSGQGAFWNTSSAITGSANWTYSASSGHSMTQGANAADAFYMKRFTDSTPTGNFLHFQNNAANADVFKLDVNGNLTTAGTITFNSSTAGTLQLTQGSQPTLVANAIQLVAPTSVAATGEQFVYPGTPTSGFIRWTNTAGVLAGAFVPASGVGSCTGQVITAVNDNAAPTCNNVTAAMFTSQSANTFLAAPNGSAGIPTFRTIVSADYPAANLASNANGGVSGILPIANGGTNAATASGGFNNLSPMTTAGDIIYGGASGSGTRLAAGTATQLLHSGTTPSWSAVSLTADVTGTLPIANGGTNDTSANYSTNGAMYYDGTKLLTTATGGAGTLCLVSTGGGAPTFGSCSGGASTSWSNLTNPSGNLSLSMGANTTTFTSNATTGSSVNPWTWTDTTNNTGTGDLVLINTASGSALSPFRAAAKGTANGVEMNTSGVLASIGSGSITANTVSLNVNTSSPLTGGGALSGNLTLACATCVTSGSALTNNLIVIGSGGGQGTASLSAGTAGQVLTSNGSSAPGYIDYPMVYDVPAANCNNTTAGAGWSIGASGTVTCRAGTNNLGGFIAITDTASSFATFQITIPEDWDTGTNPYIRFQISSTDAVNNDTIIPSIQVACYKGDGSTTDDVAANAAHSLSTITLNGNANRFWSTSNVQMNSTDVTGCVAGALMQITVGRATDTASNARFWSATVTVPRKIVVQAN